ncbi:hypothetical protein [Natronorubrum thiooxidans]|uniref:Uncharacterized protein n=1 Tax=Natronorubrum thiooxidans TaxID=308853 RepID=A0A1N7HA30_9EURY|nr:hypothetical protein [Natronorubrum thiooxidans]SIS21727.1 hypothetical protein SAMN05421752_1406 [Natronorubrum thiooxidans]
MSDDDNEQGVPDDATQEEVEEAIEAVEDEHDADCETATIGTRDGIVMTDGAGSVFVDGAATTCPDCGGQLEYQSRSMLVCLACEADYEHWKTTDEHRLVTVDLHSGDIERVATAPRDADPAGLRDGETRDDETHASRTAQQLAMIDDDLQTDGGVIERTDSRLEHDDHQHCKLCGMEIEIDTEGTNGIRWNPFEQEWVAVEKCAPCKAEELLKQLSNLYSTNVAFDVPVRGMDIESEVKR